MEISKQVCSLNQSKKLKELLVKQTSEYKYITFRNESSPKEQWKTIHTMFCTKEYIAVLKEKTFIKNLTVFSAYTVAELGFLLKLDSSFGSFRSWWNSGENVFEASIYANNEILFMRNENTEAEARAGILIDAIEGLFLSIEQINKNL